MPDIDEPAIRRASEAARQRSPWRLYGFVTETDQLLFHAEGKGHPRWRWEADDWLVCRSPRYVRLENKLGDFQIMTGRSALEVMRHSPPAALLTEDAKVLLDRSDGRDLCVVCDGISYPVERRELSPNRRAKPIPLPIHGQLSADPLDHDMRPIGQVGFLADIQGATLKWWCYGIGHQMLVLVATGLPGAPYVIQCCVTQYVDCPTVMHHVHFRMATPEERESLRSRVSSSLAPGFDPGYTPMLSAALQPAEGLLVIECDEGAFLIWAWSLLLSWREKTKFPGFVSTGTSWFQQVKETTSSW